VLSNGDNIGAGDLGDGDTAVGLVGSVEVDVVGADTSGDGDLEVLGLGQTLGTEVTRVEAIRISLERWSHGLSKLVYSRRGNDDFSVDELLVELGVLALLVGSGDEGVALVLEPLADAELVLGGSEELRNLKRVRVSRVTSILSQRSEGGGDSEHEADPLPRQSSQFPAFSGSEL
jgi:hypothetical protein